MILLFLLCFSWLHFSLQFCVHPVTPPTFSSPLPTGTLNVLNSCHNSTNGLQNIRVKGNFIVQLYCFNRKEYLLLPNAGGTTGKNYFFHYCAIRLDPVTLLVDIGDDTFSVRTGTHSGWVDANSAPYGSAAECRFGQIGTANINTRDTPFIVDPEWRWFAAGAGPRDNTTTRSDENYNVDITGAGNCGYNTPGYALHPNPTMCHGSFSLGLILKNVPEVKPCPQAEMNWWRPYASRENVTACPSAGLDRLLPEPRFDSNCQESSLYCVYSEWSAYSACSASCRDDTLPIPVRSRTAYVTAGTCAHYEETSPCPSLPLCSTKPTAIDTTTEPTSVRTTEPTTTKAATSTTMVKNPTTSMIRPSTPAASISTTSKKPTTDQSTDSQATTVKVATKDQTTNDQASVVQGTTDSPMVDTTEIVGTNSSTFQLTDNDNVFSSSGQDLLFYLYIFIPVFVVLVLLVAVVVYCVACRGEKSNDTDMELNDTQEPPKPSTNTSIYGVAPSFSSASHEYTAAPAMNAAATYDLAPAPSTPPEAGGIYAAGPSTIDSIYNAPPSEAV